MAKKKLFGNHSEPRCETCARGKLSADGTAVLCKNGGALPLTHHCRQYRYDPLRRVPKRRTLLGDYSAADFALDELSQPAATDTQPVSDTDAPRDPVLDDLRTYLAENDSPDANAILAILGIAEDASPKTDADETADTAQENAQGEELPVDDEGEGAPASTVLRPDDSPDIFGDLERLNIAVNKSTTPAAFRTFSLHLAESGEDEEVPLSFPGDAVGDPILMLSDNSAEDDAPLTADDLLFMTAAELASAPDAASEDTAADADSE